MKKIEQKTKDLNRQTQRGFYFSQLITSFKKFLFNDKTAQAALEYFILFATVSLLTFVTLSVFFINDRLKNNVGTNFFVKCVNELMREE